MLLDLTVRNGAFIRVGKGDGGGGNDSPAGILDGADNSTLCSLCLATGEGQKEQQKEAGSREEPLESLLQVESGFVHKSLSPEGAAGLCRYVSGPALGDAKALPRLRPSVLQCRERFLSEGLRAATAERSGDEEPLLRPPSGSLSAVLKQNRCEIRLPEHPPGKELGRSTAALFNGWNSPATRG